MEQSRRALLVAATFLGSFIVLLDVSIVNVALPAIQRDLAADLAGLQWIGASYTLCLSALLLSAGAISDRFGRRRVWLAGIVVFTLGSAVCALSNDLAALLTGRVVQGIGGALLIPGPLAILSGAFPDSTERATAIGWWSAFCGISLIIGPILGGVMISALGWRSVFLINLPVGLITIVLGALSISESSDPDHASFDPAGQVLSIGCLGALSLGLIEAGHSGWISLSSMSMFAIAAIAGVAFLIVERRSSNPMLPTSLFASPDFSATILASFTIGFSAFSSLFVLSLFFQEVQGLTPASTGWRLTPQFVAVAIVSFRSGWLSQKFGAWNLIVTGFVCMSAAFLMLTLVGAHSSFSVVAPALVLLGCGMGLAIPCTSVAAMVLATKERSGIASATVNAARQTGLTVGVALIGALMSGHAIAILTNQFRRAGIVDAHANAIRAVTTHSSVAASALLEGFHLAMAVSAASAACIAVYIWVVSMRSSVSSLLRSSTQASTRSRSP